MTNPRQVTAFIPKNFEFSWLEVSRDPDTLELDFQTEPLEAFGLPVADMTDNELTSAVLQIYYFHLSTGGERDLVCEQIMAEMTAEAKFGAEVVIPAPANLQ